jgi:hypothetical protein
MNRSDAVVLLQNEVVKFESEQGMWSAAEKRLLWPLPCNIVITDRRLILEDAYPILACILGANIAMLIRWLKYRARVRTYDSPEISRIKVSRGYIDNPVARKRVQNNARMRYLNASGHNDRPAAPTGSDDDEGEP